MYKVNDTVIYSTQGVCRIVEIAEKDFLGQKKEYYVLKSINNSGTTFFAPTGNETVLAKFRRILSKEEIQELVDSLKDEKLLWIIDENERRERFREILTAGNHRNLILMIKAIWLEKQNREAQGKKLHISDERFFREAEQLLYDEFQYVLEITKEDLISYIFKPKE